MSNFATSIVAVCEFIAYSFPIGNTSTTPRMKTAPKSVPDSAIGRAEVDSDCHASPGIVRDVENPIPMRERAVERNPPFLRKGLGKPPY